MKISLDLNRCAGYGNCVDASPEVFEMSDVEDVAEILISEPRPELHESVRKAARVCPADAIIIKEA
ncbi:ferredoxin [Nocardia pseudovaccinii]|uniref:ferredoxin n=1 Tax=Nocardia pseudovaccinii TaxID=189540 RepID=UPI003D9028EB